MKHDSSQQGASSAPFSYAAPCTRRESVAQALDSRLFGETPLADVPLLLGRVHKGLRYTLCQILVQLGRVLPEDRVACSQLVDDLDGALYFVERHLERTERYLYPALEQINAEVLSQAHARQHCLAEAAHEVRRKAFALEARSPLNDADLDDLYLVLSQFVGDLLLHLYVDETVVIPKLLADRNPEAVEAVVAAMRHSMGPDERAVFQRTLGPASRP